MITVFGAQTKRVTLVTPVLTILTGSWFSCG